MLTRPVPATVRVPVIVHRFEWIGNMLDYQRAILKIRNCDCCGVQIGDGRAGVITDASGVELLVCETCGGEAEGVRE